MASRCTPRRSPVLLPAALPKGSACARVATTSRIANASPKPNGWLREGHFLEGSMQPKVEAALYFLKHGGKKTVIAHLNQLAEAVAGRTGTHILPG